MDECQTLPCTTALCDRSSVRYAWEGMSRVPSEPVARGLHSSTSQLNLSRFWHNNTP